MITEEVFRAIWGFEPANDDLERVNCQKAGETTHSMCGICEKCSKPRFICGHMIHSPKDKITLA